jgi:cytochrome P450
METLTGGGITAPRLDFDPFSIASIRSPIECDGKVRDAAPVVWLEKYGTWATGRHDLVKAVLEDWETFSSAKRPFSDPAFPLPAILVTEDPPGHTRTRRVMDRMFSAPAVRRLRAQYDEVAESFVDASIARGAFDAVQDLVVPYVVSVFGDAIGLPEDGRQHLVPFGAAVLNTLAPPNELFMQIVRDAAEAIPWIEAHCERSALTVEGFGGQLYVAVDEGRLTNDEARLLVKTLLSAGVDTTVGSIANAIYAFACNPDQWELLHQNPTLTAVTFEEVLRYYPPARIITRTAVKDTQLSGVRLAEGDGIVLFFSAAAHDARIWENPAVFDIKRNPVGQLSFGFGIHTCVGQMLSRYEAIALLGALVKKIRRIDLAGEPEVLMSNLIQSFSHLPVRVTPA